jgi:hypothetical protein
MMTCRICNSDSDTRMGVCFDCATSAERIASKRTVFGHLRHAVKNLIDRNWLFARFDLSWAWQRFTRTGDYASDGAFAEYEWERPQ